MTAVLPVPGRRRSPGRRVSRGVTDRADPAREGQTQTAGARERPCNPFALRRDDARRGCHRQAAHTRYRAATEKST
ncbi:MAG TPA: hypothetical protein ENN80_14355 [Candidatus Hydrogenedentes bacterium]|nr:hypothetical protein [Candidatus Hydrogenedentota bacterium]